MFRWKSGSKIAASKTENKRPKTNCEMKTAKISIPNYWYLVIKCTYRMIIRVAPEVDAAWIRRNVHNYNALSWGSEQKSVLSGKKSTELIISWSLACSEGSWIIFPSHSSWIRLSKSRKVWEKISEKPSFPNWYIFLYRLKKVSCDTGLCYTLKILERRRVFYETPEQFSHRLLARNNCSLRTFHRISRQVCSDKQQKPCDRSLLHDFT